MLFETQEKEYTEEDRKNDLEVLKEYMELALKKKEKVNTQKILDLGFTEEFIEYCKKNGYLIEYHKEDYRWI